MEKLKTVSDEEVRLTKTALIQRPDGSCGWKMKFSDLRRDLRDNRVNYGRSVTTIYAIDYTGSIDVNFLPESRTIGCLTFDTKTWRKIMAAAGLTYGGRLPREAKKAA